MAHSLANPCYVDGAPAAASCSNDLGGSNENEYATCRFESNGNVYVEMGSDEIPTKLDKCGNYLLHIL